MRDESAEQRALEVIHGAIDTVNEMLPPETRIGKSPETRLVGDGTMLDSLALVNLIVALEAGIESVFGETLVLVDERLATAEKNPFSTISTLAAYIALRITKQTNGQS